MQTMISTLVTISCSWRRRLMPTAAALALLLMFVFAQSGFAQSSVNQLHFGNNFFVTGDYVVGGAYGMNTNFASDGTTKGTITIPDNANPGITGAKSVPAGAQIVAAILYWGTVEKVGQLGSGQNGFFRPTAIANGPQTGYPITGVSLPNSSTVSFSFGGCTGGSTGKVLRAYRADVLGLLPRDASGNVLANSTYEVRLPSVGPSAPLTLGATLVLIYRVISPNFPLNSIVIYDGAFAPGGTLLNMTQTVQGFYEAAAIPVSRLTHIVAGGKSNKFETVSLNGVALHPPYNSGQPFPGWYGDATGYGWDNTTWTFPDPNNPGAGVQPGSASATTMVAPSSTQPQGCVAWGAVIVSTTVKNSDGDGLLDVWKVPPAPHSLTPGYCDAAVNEGQCNGPGDRAWVDLPGAAHGQKDLFIQLDYMCSSKIGDDSCDTHPVTPDFTNYSFDPRLTGADVLMTTAFSAHGIHLHINPVNPMGTTQPVHAIQEQTCMDNNPSHSPLCAPTLQPFPNQPGVVGWKTGFEFLKNQPLNYTTEADCLANTPPAVPVGPNNCVRRFQHGRKDSYHYAVFAHAIGRANWRLRGGSLTSVVASRHTNTVTFTTATPHGLVMNNNLGNGRVTIHGAITNPNLNGTHLVNGVNPGGVLTITQTSMAATGTATYTFTQNSGAAPITGDLVTIKNTTNGNGVFNVDNAQIAGVVGSTFTVNFNVNGFMPSLIAPQPETGDAQTNRAPFFFTISTPVTTDAQYTQQTDPNFSVTSGQASLGSGASDFGGADTLVTLGLWGDPSKPLTNPPGQSENVQAGTFMHELGHTLGLTHGGFFYDNLALDPQDYRPTVEANCKPNFQSVMNYMFQFTLLGPSSALDFSREQLDALNENSLLPISPVPVFTTTSWYDLTQAANQSPAKRHCDGTPKFFSTDVTPIMFPHYNKNLPSPWSAASLDVNFDGRIETIGFRGYNDWVNIDQRQIGAVGTDVLAPGGVGDTPGGVGDTPGGVGDTPGGVGDTPGGVGDTPGGVGDTPGGIVGAEIDFTTYNSVTFPPSGLTVIEDPSPRNEHLFFFPPSGHQQDAAFNIYRRPPWVPGNPATFSVPLVGDPRLTFHNDPLDPHFGQYEFVDTTATCLPSGYTYFVSAALANTTPPQESEPSNTVSTGQNGERLTSCYGPTGFNLLLPANAVHGSIVSMTWTVQDASNMAGFAVSRSAVNTLVVNGPLPNSCATVGDITILANGTLTAQSGALSTFSQPSPGQYMFNLDTDGFCAGQYTVKLILDNQLALSSHQMATAPLRLSIDVNDTDTLHIDPTTLTAGTVESPYPQYQLTQHGGVGAVAWSFSGNLPPANMSETSAGLISGIPCTAGTFNFMVTVTDSKSNSGTLGLNLQINKANTTTGVMSNANPSVFQQMVTFTVTVAPNSPCIPMGTVTLLDGGVPIASASNLQLTGGIATFKTSALSVGIHQITASYGGDPNFNASNSPTLSQTVNQANTTIAINSVSPSPAFVGQPITVAYNFAVVPPGGGIPIGPSGTITVTASDGSSCMALAALGTGACVLSPTPTTAGIRTFTITYPGDNNFVLSAANGGNYTVYQLVFTVQPSNTGVGLTMTPAVQVAAQDASNTTLTSFTGSITLATGSGPGKLSGTTTQNAVSGVATFNDLSINQMANGYTLVASLAGGVAPVTSNVFNIDGLLFAGTDHNTIAITPLPDQLGRFTINGPNQTGVGVVLSVPYYINGMAQTGNFLYAGDPNTNTLRSIDFNGNPVTSVFTGNVSSVTAGFPNACCNEAMLFDANNNVLWHAHFSSEIEKLNPATGAVMATTLSITNTVASGTTAVFTVPNTVNLIAGQTITVTGCTTAGLNATYTITSVTSTTVTVPSAVNVTEAEPAAAQLMSAYGQPDVVGITFVGSTIWITKWAGKQVGTWDPTTNTFTPMFSTPANAGGLAYDPVNGILWVGLQGGSIVPYNPVTGLPLNAGFSPLNTGGDTVDGLAFVSKVP